MNVCIIEKCNNLFNVDVNSAYLFKRFEVEDIDTYIRNSVNSKVIENKEIGLISYCGVLTYLYLVTTEFDYNASYISLEDLREIPIRDALDYVILDKYIKMHMLDEIDELTGLFNQNACLKYQEEMREYNGENLYVFAIDVNGLKNANDTMGYYAGDELLKGCAGVMLKVFDGIGKCFRNGGDEFMAIVKDHEIDPEDYWSKLKKEARNFEGSYIKDMSISVGYSTVREDGHNIKELVYAANASMHTNKQEYYDRKFKKNGYKAENEIAMLSKQIHDTFELLPVGIAVVDIKENYSYIRFNTPFMKFFGFDKVDDFSNLSFIELLNSFGIELDNFDTDNRIREYMVKGHKLKINFSIDREYGETLFVALYI